MKSKLIAAAILLSILSQTCKSDDPMYYPGIIAMSVAGFAREDIQIDQARREIILAMPATVSTTLLKPTFRLTSDAAITDGLTVDGMFDFSNYCPCMFGEFPGTSLPTITLKSNNLNLSASYRIRLKARAPLVIKSLPTAPTYSISDKSVRGVIVPVENYYGSKAIRKFTITNVNTGKSAYTSADGACLNDCSTVGLNRMAISLNFFLRDFDYGFGPGFYTVEFRLNDGTLIKTPQAIQVVP